MKRQEMIEKMGRVKTIQDKRTCGVCSKKAGMTNETPPFHPNCRCRIVGNKVFNEAGVALRSYETGTYSPQGYKIGGSPVAVIH